MTIERFPGGRPFETKDSELFFGRSHATETLFQQLSINQSILLYSKSGLGKSSLINAGVVPLVRQSGKFCDLKIRFNLFNENDSNYLKPTDKVIFGLEGQRKRITTLINEEENSEGSENIGEGKFLDRLIPNENSLWYYAKKWQCRTSSKFNLLLVFDQFEELFSYSETDIFIFKKQLADLLRESTPQVFRKVLEVKQRKEPEILSAEEIDLLEQPIKVKVIFAIRSDRMSQLDRLRDFLPEILKNTFELKPLTLTEATEAITVPALQQNTHFTSKPFSFNPVLLKNLLDYLSENGKKDIETFQLQIICKYAETLILNTVIAENELQQRDLGDFQDIFSNYYNRLIQRISNLNQQAAARLLIEDQLIVEGNRVTLPDTVILRRENREHGMNQVLLQDLVNTHLLRSETNTLGGISFEISHDTLVAPILEARKIRLEKEAVEEAERERLEEMRIAKEKAEKERIEREKEDKKQRKIIAIVSVAAIMAIAFGVFGFVMWQKSNDTLRRLIDKDANSFYNEERFLSAKLKYEQMIEFSDTIAAIKLKIKDCIQLDSMNKVFYRNLNRIDTLLTHRDIQTILLTDSLIKATVNLNYKPGIAKLENVEKTLKLRKDNLINEYLVFAESLFNKGLREDALIFVHEAEKLSPDNQKLQTFKSNRGLKKSRLI